MNLSLKPKWTTCHGEEIKPLIFNFWNVFCVYQGEHIQQRNTNLVYNKSTECYTTMRNLVWRNHINLITFRARHVAKMWTSVRCMLGQIWDVRTGQLAATLSADSRMYSNILALILHLLLDSNYWVTVVWHLLLPLTNSFDKTEAVIFSMQGLISEDFLFFSDMKCLINMNK